MSYGGYSGYSSNYRSSYTSSRPSAYSSYSSTYNSSYSSGPSTSSLARTSAYRSHSTYGLGTSDYGSGRTDFSRRKSDFGTEITSRRKSEYSTDKSDFSSRRKSDYGSDASRRRSLISEKSQRKEEKPELKTEKEEKLEEEIEKSESKSVKCEARIADIKKNDFKRSVSFETDADQNRNRALNSTPTRSSGYGKSSSSQQPDIVSNSIKSNRSQEVTRLESLCETRTKELNLVKIELKSTEKALDALACLIRYLTEELDAFSCPKVKTDLAQAQELQKQAQEQIAELQKVKRDLEEKLSEITKQQEESLAEITKLKSDMVAATEAHETAVKELKEQHEKKLKEETEKLEKNHTASTAKMRDSHEKMHHFMKVQSERELSDQKFESQSREDMLKVKHLEDIQELRNKHDRQMEELHRQHRNKLDDINKSFEYIKCTLGEKVECLRGECEELKYRAKQSEDALLRDTDVRVQMALAPYKHLPEEVDSLKAVVEMRNEEILKLRKQKMDLEKQLDELPIAREKIISLQQKIENLDAIVNLKSGHEKQLHDKVQILMSKYAKESKANKRLSMDYEELMYKMAASPEIMTTSQESLFKRQISRSPPGSECSSPDLRRKAKSPFDNGNGDQPSPRRSRKSNGDRKSQTDESLERKLNRRSQTFVLEKKSSTSTSPHHLSPSKIPNGSPMSTSLESEGSQVPVDIPPSDATDLDLSVSVSLNELGVAALEDSMVSNNSDSAAYISDSEVFDSPMKQKQNGDDEVVGKLELETDV
ncbi:hypothetical protein LOTGIDRAFT_228499 [Lottia gigantea]|uniref:Uncharacterized protein n=1 Tax=Lottia gigantea TaxID=225164 RepID=V4AA93_LOTGI|nr:hypothetical protein LOTGIDRAFT_228499 [Lottia gigantea]ESO93687.1 hypothetical protein LOTGIDRAFT_228499 [Lottia gigantea]